ncbi:MAG: NUDIX domain-containing protein [Candidatus Pacearchaeota archaeon]
MENNENGKSFRKAVFIVVYRKDKEEIKYLLLKRELNWKGWEFPKGGLEEGESEVEAVKREIKEETGLRAKKINRHSLKGRYYFKKKNSHLPYIGQTYTLYSAEVNNDKIRYDKREHSDYRWLNFKEAIRKLTWTNQKRSLRVVNSYLTREN